MVAFLSASPVCPGASPAERGKMSSLPDMYCAASGRSVGTAALPPRRIQPGIKRPDRRNISHQSRESKWTHPWRRCPGRSCSCTPEAPAKRIPQKQRVLPVGVVRAAAEKRGKPDVRPSLAVPADGADACPIPQGAMKMQAAVAVFNLADHTSPLCNIHGKMIISASGYCA